MNIVFFLPFVLVQTCMAMSEEGREVGGYVVACQDEYYITSQEREGFYGPDLKLKDASPNLKCHLKCVMEQMGHLVDGVFDDQKALEDFTDFNIVDASDHNKLGICKDEKGENDCETAWKIGICIRQKMMPNKNNENNN